MNNISLFNWIAIALLGATLFVGCTSPTKLFEENHARAPFDAIIVPGVPFDTAWDRTMRGRVLWSYYLYEQGIAKNIIYSGSAVYTPYVESMIMAEYGKGLGIPDAHIFTETNAEHSTENLSYSVALAQEQGFKNIALATDPYQSAMLKSYNRKLPVQVSFMPFISDTLDYYYKEVEVSIDPDGAYVEDFTSLPDREGFFKRLKGTMGLNAKKEHAKPDQTELSAVD